MNNWVKGMLYAFLVIFIYVVVIMLLPVDEQSAGEIAKSFGGVFIEVLFFGMGAYLGYKLLKKYKKK